MTSPGREEKLLHLVGVEPVSWEKDVEDAIYRSRIEPQNSTLYKTEISYRKEASLNTLSCLITMRNIIPLKAP